MQRGKKKRGRPHKQDVDLNMQPAQAEAQAPSSSSSMPPSSAKTSSANKRKGRPSGAGKLKQVASAGGLAAETVGGSFTPQVMTVDAGEDLVSKILSSFQRGTKSVCILSATGAASRIVISNKKGSSKDISRYEGRFPILSLSGSYLYKTGPTGICRRQQIFLSASFSDAEGKVFGGAPLDSLIAAGPIHLVVGIFKQDMKKQSAGSSAADADADAAGPSMFSDPRLKEEQQRPPSPTSGLIPTTNENTAAAAATTSNATSP